MRLQQLLGALLPLGLIDEIALLDKEIAEHEEHAEADGDDDHSNTQNAAEDSAGIDAANQPSTDLRAQMESRLLGTPAVQQQLDKIRAHEDKLEQQQQQQQRKLQQGTQGADADKNHDTESGAPSKKRQRGERKKKAKAEEEEEEEEEGPTEQKKPSAPQHVRTRAGASLWTHSWGPTATTAVAALTMAQMAKHGEVLVV